MAGGLDAQSDGKASPVAHGQSGEWPVSSRAEVSVWQPGVPPEHRSGQWPTVVEAGAKVVNAEKEAPKGEVSPVTPAQCSAPGATRAVWPEVKRPPEPSEIDEELWPKILEAVKHRRRFAWILLSQNARMKRVDAQTVELIFAGKSSKENYKASGVDTVLESVLREDFGLSWNVKVVDEGATHAVVRMPHFPHVNRPGAWPTIGSLGDGTDERSPTPSSSTDRRVGAWPIVAMTGESEHSGGKWPGERESGVHGEFLNDPVLRDTWQRVLEGVKVRRRFAWLVLSQKAKVVGFDGRNLRLVFSDEQSRGVYRSAGLDQVLEEVLQEIFGDSWTVDVVDE
ncbi:hypothetical protein GCM10010245_69490 [Streptomyces spectabilis]|nr:hypothetical protein GCM10010245_69490 [Streptomyces spectabilis]